MKKTTVIGLSTVDYIAHVKEFPERSQHTETENPFFRIAGFGWTAAGIYKAFQIPVHLISSVGTGVYGDAVRQAMKEKGFDLSHSSEALNGCVFTLADAEGNLNPIVNPGAEYELKGSWAQETEDSSAVLMSSELIRNAGYMRFCEQLKAQAVPLYMEMELRDVLSDDEGIRKLLALRPLVYASAETAAAYCETAESDFAELVRLFHRQTGCAVLVRLRRDLILYKDGETELSVDLSVSVCVDPSGSDAGFLAGFALARSAGLRVDEALCFGAGIYRDLCESVSVELTEAQISKEKNFLTKLLMR